MFQQHSKQLFPKSGVYPFWFWNGKQDDIELLRQLRNFKSNGCKGVVIHSRTGNQIPYLGEVWFHQFELVCQDAQRLKMKIWIYDEDGYPSGNAGLKLPEKYPHLVQKILYPQFGKADPDNPAYAAYLPDNPDFPVNESAVTPGTELLRFILTEYTRHVDVLHPETCRRFMEMTHRKYEHLRKYFGNVIQAVYTDDLSFQVFHQPGYVFSPALEMECQQQGRPLKSLLGHLALNTPESAGAREFFYLTAQRMFLENFVRPQMNWCHCFGMNYLGHLCGDEGPLVQSIRNFGSAQPFLRLEDIPSVDDFFTGMHDQRYLARPTVHDIDRNHRWETHKCAIPLLTFKLASSIANCFAKQNFSSETLAFLGWDCTPDFVQQQMLFEIAQGVNLFTHHAYYYTVAGESKRDCPPSWSYQQPMFDIFGKMNRLWTHVAKLLRRGKYAADTLIIYPTSLLSLPEMKDVDRNAVSSDSDSRINRAESAFANLLLELNRRHICFDILDETIINREVRVMRNGFLKAGAMKYRTVICPDKLPLGTDTEKLLTKFKQCGGKVISAVDAVHTLSPDLLIVGDGNEEVFVTVRQVKNHREYLLLNLSGRDLRLQIPILADKNIKLYDPLAKKSIHPMSSDLQNLLLRKGAILMLMSPEFMADAVEFASSQYAEYNHSTLITPDSVTFDRDNILRLESKEKIIPVTVEKGAVISSLLAECAASKIKINGKSLSGSTEKTSDCDCGIREISCRGFFKEGINTITINSAEPIYLKGKFTVDPETRTLQIPRIITGHGDLAAMGYPNYCGKITYSYCFKGKYTLLEIDLANASHIKINGKRAGIIFGNPHLINVETFCNEGENTLEIELFNQFGNFIADTAPYGIKKVTIWKNL